MCFRAAEGWPRSRPSRRRPRWSPSTADRTTETRVDEYGYTWLTVRTDPPDVGAPGHRPARRELRARGPGLRPRAALLDGRLPLRRPDQPAFVVYLYKQGTFYPFCPTGPTSRDTLLERQVRDAIGADLPIEEDTSRWMPIWGIQG